MAIMACIGACHGGIAQILLFGKELRDIREVDGRFFLTCTLIRIEITGLRTRLSLPWESLGTRVITADEVLIQPVDYEQDPGGAFASVSLVI